MTETTASLIIKVDSSGAKRASDDLDKLTRASGQAEQKTGLLTGAWKGLMTVAASAALAKSVGMYIRLADESANLAAKLKLVTGSTQAATAAQRDLFQLSQSTSSDLSATTELYVKLGQSSKELAGNHELLLGITEKVSKALVISGADAASSAAVIRQFSQAMAAGALRGDEFISVMEGAPRLAQAIAAGMGVSVGALRTLAAEGKLTSDAIIKALEDQGAVLDREFGEMPLTVGLATQQVRNALLAMVGDTEKTSGATSGLAEAIAQLARTLESQEVKDGFASAIEGIAGIGGAAAEAIGWLSRLDVKIKESLGLSADGQTRKAHAQDLWGGWQSGMSALLSGDLAGTRAGKDRMLQGLRGTWDNSGEVANFTNVQGGVTTSADRWANVQGGVNSGSGAASTSISADLQKEIDKIKEQAAAYGLSRVELAKLNQEKALAAATNDAERAAINESYGALIKSIKAGDASKESKKDEKKAAEELNRAYESYNSRLREANDIIGTNTNLVKLNAEIQHGALKGLSEDKQKELREQAEWLDLQEDMKAYNDIWKESASDRNNELNKGRAAADDLIDSLKFELSIIGKSNVEREKAIALRNLEAGATKEQRDEIAKLTESVALTRRATDEMTEFSRQAARNMQDAFADFLFDPFENGVKGMLDSFAKTLKRMAAEAVASKLFSAMGQWGTANAGQGGWVGAVASVASAYAGNKAAGGPMQAGSAAIVGDSGKPELFIPSTSGTLYPLGKGGGGGGNVVVNVHNAPPGTKVEQSRTANGGSQIDVLLDGIKKAVAGDIASGGATAAAIKGRFGLREATG